MTKKDYILIANVVNDFKKTSTDNNKPVTQGHIDNLVDMLSYALKRENSSFDADRFSEACNK